MIAPEIQKVAIEDHAARSGYRIVDWVEALDDSGSQKRSPWWRKLDAVVARVEAGEVDVIVGWKFSRTARNRLRWAIAIDRVETAGGRIESATEPLDVTTSAGRLARGMLAEFNAFEAERIGEVWKEVHARRTRMGLPANGKPRFGYEMRDGVHRPDPKTAAVLASLYRRYIAGESVYTLVEWLNVEGFRTATGYSTSGPGRWTQMTLRRVLDSGFGAGLIRVGGELQEGAHEPVIDRPTWEQYQAARAARRTLRRSERSEYLLSGLVKCAHQLDDETACGSSMGGGQFGHARQPKYRCIAAAAERRHAGGYVMMSLVEDAVIEWLADIAAEVEPVANQVQHRSPGRRRTRDAEVTAREIAKLEQQLVTLTVQHSAGVVPESAYIAARDQIAGERDLLEQRHAQEVLAASQSEAGPIAADLLRLWDSLLVAERRAILRSLIRRVEVTPGRPRGTVAICPVWGG